MLEFKPIELSDKPSVDKSMWAEDSRSADFNFANIYMWDERFNQSLAHIGGRSVIKPMYAVKPFFVYPVGSGDLKSAVEELKDYAAQHRFPFCLRGVTNDVVEKLDELFPGRFRYTDDRAFYDYIYLAEKLASLAGKKLHSKRNHINRFVESHDWSFEPLTPELIPECMEMLDAWTVESIDSSDHTLAAEHIAISRAFDNYVNLGLEGGILRIGEKMVAFSVGEKISSDTYNIHYEKAFADIQGAYPMINREFARYALELHPEIVYINREDDMGRENLRKAKLSYYPEFLIEKHTAIWK